MSDPSLQDLEHKHQKLCLEVATLKRDRQDGLKRFGSPKHTHNLHLMLEEILVKEAEIDELNKQIAQFQST